MINPDCGPPDNWRRAVLPGVIVAMDTTSGESK